MSPCCGCSQMALVGSPFGAVPAFSLVLSSLRTSSGGLAAAGASAGAAISSSRRGSSGSGAVVLGGTVFAMPHSLQKRGVHRIAEKRILENLVVAVVATRRALRHVDRLGHCLVLGIPPDGGERLLEHGSRPEGRQTARLAAVVDVP